MSFWRRVRWSVFRQFHQARNVFIRLRIGEEWEHSSGLSRRRYPDYRTYVAHQKTKFSALRLKSIEGHDRRFYSELSARIAALPDDFRGRSVLCLGARQGTEVRVFIDRGAFSIGVDLNPGPRNQLVVVGDFHRLQFADASVDVVYTNALDHAFELGRVIKEVRRVLKPNGMLIVEANREGGEGAGRGAFESLVWNRTDALVEAIEQEGLRVVSRTTYQEPWHGDQVILQP